MDQWSLYIDIEGFSATYETDTQALVSLGALTEAIYQVGSRGYPETPERLFAHQLGDGFVVVGDFGQATLEQPVTVAVILIRAVLQAGGAAKGAISEGGFSDTLGCLPESVQNLYGRSDGAPIPLGNGLMTILPVMGTALINSHRLLHSNDTPSGPLLVLRRSDEERLPSWVKTTASDSKAVVDWIHSSSPSLDEVARAAGLPVSSPASMEARLRAYIDKSRTPQHWRDNAERFLLSDGGVEPGSDSVSSVYQGQGVGSPTASAAYSLGDELSGTGEQPDNRSRSPRNLFILGAGFTKAIHPDAPLNDGLVREVVGPEPNSSALGRAWAEYGETNIERLLTRFDLDLSSGHKIWTPGDREEIEAQLAGYVKRFRFAEDAVWFRSFLTVIQDNDVIVSLNYDCALEGLLDFHKAWSPRDGYHRISNPLDEELPENARNIRILKIHGSENFRIFPFADRPDFVTIGVEINGDIFPRSGRSVRFGGGIDSRPYVIAPSFVKRQVFELQHLMLDAVRFAGEAQNLVIIGCSIRPEDSHLRLVLTNFLTGPWQQKRIFIVDPHASEIGRRLERFFSRAIFDQNNLICLDGGLQDTFKQLRASLNAS
jgi:hypothetical protein